MPEQYLVKRETCLLKTLKKGTVSVAGNNVPPLTKKLHRTRVETE